jgi:hypothetical protein
MENDLMSWIGQMRASGGLSAADAARIQRELWPLLARKAEVLSLGDASIREEQAEELLRSLCFTVLLALEPLDDARAAEKLAARPVRALYREGLERLYRRLDRAKAAYGRVRRAALPFDNLAYRDTLENLGGFFDAYQPERFAHDIPCVIDYPQFQEAKGLGAVYMEQYLLEWAREDAFLSRFDFGRVARLLNAHFLNAREQVVNLFEPVAANALGLTLVGKDPADLLVTAENGERIHSLSRALGESAFRARLDAAADGLSIKTGADGALLRLAAGELAARVALLPAPGMGGVFTAF